MKKLIIILGVVGASFSAILVRLTSAPSLVLVFLRMAFAAAILIPWSLISCREELRQMTRRELGLSALSGVFLGLHFICYFSSLRHTSIAASLVLVDTEVFFVALLSWLLWRKKLSKLGALGIALTFLGSLLVVGGDISGGGNALLGDVLALMGAVFVGVYTIIGTEVRKTRSTTAYTMVVYTAGAITVGLMLLITDTPVVGYAPADYLCAAGLTLFCTLLGHSVFSWGLHYESPAFVSTAKLLEPVFAAGLGALLFAEYPAVRVILGGVLVIFGVAWYSFHE